MRSTDYKQHNKASYNEIAAEYLEHNLKKPPEYLLDMLGGLPENMNILDIGSGPGNLIPILQTLSPKLILELDNSPEMLRLAKHSFHAANIEFVEADYHNFQSNIKFGLIIAHLSFVHLPPEELPAMLEKVKNQLNNNAWLFANYFLAEQNDFKLIKMDYKAGREESRYFAVYNSDYIDKCYQKAGFEIVKKGNHHGRHFDRYNLLARKL